jgi:hypothetical protein
VKRHFSCLRVAGSIHYWGSVLHQQMPQTTLQISFITTSWSFMWSFCMVLIMKWILLLLLSHKHRSITNQIVSLCYLHCSHLQWNKTKGFYRHSLHSFRILGISKDPLSKFWFQLPLTLGDSWFWSAIWNGSVIEVLAFYSLSFLQLMFPLFLSFIFVCLPFQPPSDSFASERTTVCTETILSQVQKKSI